MSEKERELIAIVLEESGYFSRKRARTISSFFQGVNDFLSTSRESIKGITYASGNGALTTDEVESILLVRSLNLIDPHKPLPDNMISGLSRSFTRRQVEMLQNLSLSSLNPNPFLIQTLNLSTPEDVVRLNIYAAATRSIVTSFGMVVQTMLGSTSDSVERVKSGWDLVKTDERGKKHWVQVKSGPNDMDKDQIVYWADQISRVEAEGQRGYIGITYGKRDNHTVTLGLMKTYLTDWEMKTLIGRELWDFLSDDPGLHSRVMRELREQAMRVLNGSNLLIELESCVQRVLKEFVSQFGEGPDAVKRFVDEIF